MSAANNDPRAGNECVYGPRRLGDATRSKEARVDLKQIMYLWVVDFGKLHAPLTSAKMVHDDNPCGERADTNHVGCDQARACELWTRIKALPKHNAEKPQGMALIRMM